ncbi:MAG: tetratricopeptide repeat protein, partial [Solirubrobacteraceae bacterium]
AGAVAAAAVIFLSVFGGAVATTWQWRRAVAEQKRAETQQKSAEETLQFVVDLFNSPESGASVNQITARELLERGADRLNESQQPPEIRAALKHTLGVVYRKLGDNQQAEKLLDEAVSARERIPGAELDLAESLYQLGSIAPERGRAQLGETALQRALDIRTRLLGPDDLTVADVLEALAANVGYKIPVGKAEEDSRVALDIRRKHFRSGDPRLLPSIVGLAAVYSVVGRYAESDALFGEALAIHPPVRDGQPCRTGDDTLLSELGNLRFREGYYVDAERYTNMAISCAQRALGPDHVAVADLMIIRFRSWCELGRYGDAEVLGRQSFLQRSALHGDDSPAVDNALHHLAHVLFERGKLDEAEDKERAALT